MTHVSFYILTDEQADAQLRFACRLAEKAHGEGHRLYLRVDDAQTGEQLDKLLWTFRQGSFVPHALLSNLAAKDDPTPVVIGSGEPPLQLDGVMVNLGSDVPGFFSRFERTLEVVAPAQRAAARQRYRFYQDRGYPLQTHQIK